MLGTPNSFLQDNYRPPDRIIEPEEDTTAFYLPWGFTIYRTCYTPESDEQWRILINEIETGVEEYIIPGDEEDNPSPPYRWILSLLRLDFRSDASTLDGLVTDELRQMYMDSIGGEPMNRHNRSYMLFLVADEEVLSKSSQPATTFHTGSFGRDKDGKVRYYNSTKEIRWLKCVQPDYVAAHHVPRNWRVGGQRYFGEFKMSAGSVASLWENLGMFEITGIAPPTTPPQHLEIWDGY